MSLREMIYRDYRRYRATGASRSVAIFLTQGFWASCAYRISRLIVTRVRIKFIRWMLLVPCAIMGKFIEIVTGIYIPTSVRSGKGLNIAHFGTTCFRPAARHGPQLLSVARGDPGSGRARARSAVGRSLATACTWARTPSSSARSPSATTPSSARGRWCSGPFPPGPS